MTTQAIICSNDGGLRLPRTRTLRTPVTPKVRRCLHWLVWAFLCTADATAHGIHEATPSARALHWTFEPWEIACLMLSAVWYGAGLWRVWSRAGLGRGIRAIDALCFYAGLLIIVLALVSPLDALSDVLFSAHMVEHELLMIVAAPLLVRGRPLGCWIWAIPEQWRRHVGTFFHRPRWRRPWLVFTGPFCGWVLHALALWLWHVPLFFNAALKNEAVHALQHICFLSTALLFWWSVLDRRSRRDTGLALLSVFTTMVHTGALGALLTLSTVSWYSSYFHTGEDWNLTALQDQQLGGVIMWVPAGAIYISYALLLSYRMLTFTASQGRQRAGKSQKQATAFPVN